MCLSRLPLHIKHILANQYLIQSRYQDGDDLERASGVRPLHIGESETPNTVRRDYQSKQRGRKGNKGSLCAAVSKSTRANGKVSEQRLKRRGEVAVYLLGKVLAHH